MYWCIRFEIIWRFWTSICKRVLQISPGEPFRTLFGHLPQVMSSAGEWVGSWRPHRPRGPIAAMNNSPGPTYALPGATGMNNHDPRMQKGPAFSFGTRHHDLRSNFSPGPGYLVPSNITRVGRDGTPAYSVYSRCKDIQPFQTPGPGSYSPENSTKKIFCAAPAFSLSARTKLFRNDQTPGPAAYMLPPVLGPNVVNKSAAPNISLSGRSAIGSFHEDLRKVQQCFFTNGALPCSMHCIAY